jgi:hypothetical protein
LPPGLGRLRLLEQRYDARTFARLSALDPLAGPTAWRWAQARTPWPAGWPPRPGRPAGWSPPTTTFRFLAGAADGIEVRRHDILAVPLEPGRYDLAHCRALLCHLVDMAAAVRPGGWLIAEDADCVSLVAADPAHPRSACFDAVMRKLLAFLAESRAFNPFFGRRLPSLVAALGLADAGCKAIACHRPGGKRQPSCCAARWSGHTTAPCATAR